MVKYAKRALPSLLATASVALALVFAAGPAHAVDAQKCSDWVQLTPNTNLWAYACVKRQGSNIWGWTRVKNSDASNSFYVDRVEIKTTAGGWKQYLSVGWINAGQFKEYASYSVADSGGSDFGEGWILYWTGTSYVWQALYSPSV